MGSWDKQLTHTFYPKVVIEPYKMGPEESAFYEELMGILREKVDVADVVVEQRNGDYRTVVYGSWDNDFLRYHFGDDGFWASVRIPPDLRAELEDSPLFAAQENKRQFHWRASVAANEICAIGNVITASAVFFLQVLKDDGRRNSDNAAKLAKPVKKRPGAPKALPRTASRDLKAAWFEAKEDRKRLGQILMPLGYDLFSAREITLAGASYYKAASRLESGDVLACKADEENPYDDTAVEVLNGRGAAVGYLPKQEVKTGGFPGAL